MDNIETLLNRTRTAPYAIHYLYRSMPNNGFEQFIAEFDHAESESIQSSTVQ